MTEEKNIKQVEETESNTHRHKQTPVWADPALWHITFLMAGCSVFYYMDVIINYAGWANLRLSIFYTVHDLHRALFLIPAMYAAYKFRLKGIMAISFISLLVFLPRALAVSPYPNPLLRAFIFLISMIIIGVFLSLLLNNITKRKEMEQSLWQAQNDLLRKKSQDTLRESEDKYKSLIENIPDIIFTIDIEGKISFVSRRTKEILGYESAETINMNILNFIPEEDHQKTIENLQKGMKGEKIKHFQIPMIAKSGERLFFECSFSRIYKNGSVIGAQGTAVDITESKLAGEELRGLTEHLNLALETARAGTWVWDIISGDIEWSSQMFDLFGLDSSKNTASFAAWECALHHQDLEMAHDRINQALANHESLNSDYRIVLPSGETRWINATGKGKYDERGQPIRMMGICQDITDRKRAEEEIKKLNEELEQRVAQRTAELTAKTAELERINKVFVDRELRMRELKERIAEMENKP